MYWQNLNRLFIHSILIFHVFILAKPQYDSQPAALNSGSSGNGTASAKLPSQIVRVEGEVHAEKAEENKLPGGLHSSSNQTKPNSGLINDGRTKSKPSNSYDGDSQSLKNKPTESMLGESTPSKNSDDQSKKGQASSKGSSTSEVNPYDGSGVAQSQPQLKSVNPPVKNRAEFTLGVDDQSTTNLPSETTPTSEGSTTPNSYESTTGTSDSSTSSTGESEITQSSTTESSSSDSTTSNPSELIGSTDSNDEQNNQSTPIPDSNESESNESQEISTTNEPFTSESQIFETTSQLLTTSNTEDALPVVDENSGSAEISTSQSPPTTTQQESYETESGNFSSSPIPPTDQTSANTEDVSTLPPSFEPSSPGTTPEKTYDQTTPSSIEESSTDSSTSIPSSTPSDQESTNSEPNSTPGNQSTASLNNGEKEVTSGYETSTLSSSSTTELIETTAPIINTSLPNSKSQSSGYDSDSPASPILSKPVNDADSESHESLPSASQSIPEKPDNLPPSQKHPETNKNNPQNYDSGSESHENVNGNRKKPNSKPRAWKISQGNAAKPVDGNTNDSDGSDGSANAKSESNIDSNENGNKLQPSGYGENEVNPESQKSTNVISPKDAVGYDGIVESHPSVSRDPVVDRIEVAPKPIKRPDVSSAKKKWQRYRFDCETEVDDRGEALCREWARGGLCENRSTMFLFCRKTCLCVGPPDDENSMAVEKIQRRRRTHDIRL